MDDEAKRALETDRTIDITMTGRKTGQLRRKEIWFHNVGGQIYITGTPGRPRDWYANLIATPAFTFHLKGSASVDLAAEAAPVLDPAERKAAFEGLLPGIGLAADIDGWVEKAPLVRVTFPDA